MLTENEMLVSRIKYLNKTIEQLKDLGYSDEVNKLKSLKEELEKNYYKNKTLKNNLIH